MQISPPGAAEVCDWKWDSWNSSLRWHVLNLIIWEDMKSAFQPPHTHTLTHQTTQCALFMSEGPRRVWHGGRDHPTLWWCYGCMNIPAHKYAHRQLTKSTAIQTGCLISRKSHKKKKIWCWKMCVDGWRGPFKSFLFQKHGIKKKDRGTAVSDKRTSHFNRHRDEAWPLLTGVLSHSERRDVAIVVATSTERPAEIPHQTRRGAWHATANTVGSAFANRSLRKKTQSISQCDNEGGLINSTEWSHYTSKPHLQFLYFFRCVYSLKSWFNSQGRSGI